MSTIKYAGGTILLFFATASLLMAQPGDNRPPARQNATGSVMKGICLLYPTQGNNVTGTVKFMEAEGGVRVIALVSGLQPNSKHGFHIHEFGDCSAPDALSAGNHFNPDAKSHGGPMDHMRHAGDLGNLEADVNGNASVDYIDPMLEMRGDYSIVGLSVVVHQKEDDLKTQPTGNSGPRIACGVIGIMK